MSIKTNLDIFWKEMDSNLKVRKGKNTSTVCERIKDSHGDIVTL